MSKYQSFVFKSYTFDENRKTLKLYYGYDNDLEFCETFTFDFPFVNYDKTALDRALQLLFFMAGVSYYKAYLAPRIKIAAGSIDRPLADFLNHVYQKGLGEFFYVNQLDPNHPIDFPVNSTGLKPIDAGQHSGQLVGLGGGKDSLVSVEVLRDQPKVATWSMSHRSQLEPLVERIGLPHYWVQRTWDRRLNELNKHGALNGHIPISAIFSCVSTVVAILSGFRDAVFSNESSAGDPTLRYRGVDINHQYSKSPEYEKAFQDCLMRMFGTNLRYYSLLRPFSELRIVEFFVSLGAFEKYKDVFSSCNRAYTHDQNHMFWCGECAKCAFVFLLFTPFLERRQVEAIWSGKNLLLDPKLEVTYRQLLGIEGDKPLDCVGETKEARAAMRLAQKFYPELIRFKFDIPSSYDYRAVRSHHMPAEIFKVVEEGLIKQFAQ